jgi:hypothetical protein
MVTMDIVVDFRIFCVIDAFACTSAQRLQYLWREARTRE